MVIILNFYFGLTQNNTRKSKYESAGINAWLTIFFCILFYISSHLYFIPTKLQGLQRYARLTTVTTKKVVLLKKTKQDNIQAVPHDTHIIKLLHKVQLESSFHFCFCFVFDVFTTVTAFICLLKATDDRILISQKSRSSSRIVRHCDCVWHMHISERASHRLVLLWISTGCPHRLEMLKHR